MYTSNELNDILILIILGIFYLFRNTNSTTKMIWKVIATFFVILFATLMANFIKKELKEWWNKD